jgi:NitT/TauT family transport system ATP-binding protein
MLRSARQNRASNGAGVNLHEWREGSRERRMSDIEFAGISKTFPRGRSEFTALDNVSLKIPDKEFVAIVGPSGCGKTTLLRMVAGLETPSSGVVRVGGRPVHGPGADRAVVFQQFALFPWKTVRENIAFGLKCKGMSRADREKLALRYVEIMGLTGTEDNYPHQLSGGMQQRVAIARSYAIEPEVLLMDEPFGSLDAQTRILMQEELIRISRVNPRTVLFITHAVEEALYLADRVVVLARNPGRIVEIMDTRPTREAEGWDKLASEETMEMPGFGHLRAQIWRLLRREMQAPSREKEKT